MKILMTAIAFVIAAPAAAQTAPPQRHQGHDQHQQHPQHQPAPAQPGQQPNAPHSQHQAPAAHGDYCADRNGNGRMDCCERMAQAGDRRGCCAEQAPTPAPAPAAQPQSH